MIEAACRSGRIGPPGVHCSNPCWEANLLGDQTVTQNIFRFSAVCAGAALLVLAVFHIPAEAKVYRWIDDAGRVHYSDYKSAIPTQYRHQIKNQVKPLSSLMNRAGGQEAKLTTGTGGGEGTGSGDSKTQGGEEAGAGKKEGEGEEAGPKVDPEVLKLLVEARDYLAHENAVYRRWLRAAEFTKEEGRFFVMLVHKYLPQKEALIKKIEVSEKAKDVRVLELVKFHLADEAKKDKEAKVGGSDYLERLEAMERRLRSALIAKDGLIETLNQELKKVNVGEEQISKAQKVITQEQEALKKGSKSSIKVETGEDETPQKRTAPPPPPGSP